MYNFFANQHCVVIILELYKANGVNLCEKLNNNIKQGIQSGLIPFHIHKKIILLILKVV